MPTWLTDVLETYILPYWPWIVAAIVGVVLIRYALRRVISKGIGMVMGAVVLGGSATTGASTWLSDRGLTLPNFSFW